MPREKLVCIGAVNIDRVYAVERPVRGGEAVLCRSYAAFWGGKGLNQTVALRRAGMEPRLYAKVGKKDWAGLLELMEKNQMDPAGIIRVDGETNHGVIQVDSAGGTAIIGVPSPEINFSRGEMDQILRGMQTGDVLLVQNEIADVPYLLRAARERGLAVILNPSPLCDEMRRWPLECADMLILNETEAAALTGERKPETMLEAFSRKIPRSKILLTLGGAGCLFQDDKGTLRQSAYPAVAVDTTAAGDTFAGYFLAGYLGGGSAQAALSAAARAAAMVVSRVGAAEVIPSRREVEACREQKK